ncbi:pyridoxamine 5'-phosphate oxidase family protein [Aliivibrio sifiae]|uniref:pyridoxamine 5'-phosphate oxidase family protein n=1 Tax=Aliivibrio sifiae TaxID=566293 RepID=UPI003D0D7368
MMRNFYSENQLRIQKLNGSERIAKQLEDTRLMIEFNDDVAQIVNSSLFFFIATSSGDRNLECSYKGGNEGFVRVMSDNELAFANYDGNGMYKTLGNIDENPEVALLFIQFNGDKRRIRINGRARISTDKEITQHFPKAESVIIVEAEFIFPNCSRHIHTMRFEENSIYSPTEGYTPPEPYWKSKPDLAPYVKKR